MPYEWNRDLETGNEMIDRQHKALFNMLNELLEAQRGGKGKDELNKAVEFLTVYVSKHFENEESLQKEYNYPDTLNHKNYHEEFKQTVKKLAKQLEQEGYSDILLNNVVHVIADWLLNHIKGDDFRLAAYVKLMRSRGK